MPFTNHGLEMMGFSKLSDNECISGKFHALHIYKVVGAIVDIPALAPVSACIDGIHYQVSLGSDINEINRHLTGDVFVEDQNAWQKEHNCKPPYLIIHFGPTKEYSATGCHIIEKEEDIQTMKAFLKQKRN